MKAINRSEVSVLHRGKPPLRSVKDHPACGMWADREDMKDVAAYVRKIRQPRYSDLQERP